MSRDEWVKAIISGADNRLPSWRHVLVLSGLLLGFESHERRGLGRSLKHTLATALVKAVNASLEDVRLGGEEHGAHAVVLGLNYCFELLDDRERRDIEYDRLLPALMGAAFFSGEGFRSGYFFASVDADVVQVNEKMFSWSPRCASFKQVSDLASQPLISSMGSLSKLIAHTIEQLKDPFLIQTLMDDLLEFSTAINNQWRRTKLSEVDAHEEARYFDQTAMSQTLPVLWRLLRATLFTTSIVLQAVLSRTLNDRHLASSTIAPTFATQTLNILRNLYFISSRLGSNTLSQWTFIYLTSIDILASDLPSASTFITSIAPTNIGTIPTHPLDRIADLYFLNTAEHFTLTLPEALNRDLLLASCTPYLLPSSTTNLLEIFEAAHSVTLAVFSAPQNAELAAAHVPFYVDALFKVFPGNLSGRQFRLAFRTLVGITTSSSVLGRRHPELPEILLELVRQRVVHPDDGARAAPYAEQSNSQTTLASATPTAPPGSAPPEAEQGDDVPTTFVLTLIDSLPSLPTPLLEEWLPRTAELIYGLKEHGRSKCRERFWEVLSRGEMDIERSQVGVRWWGSCGGREMVLGEGAGGGAREGMMSGALQPGSRL